MYQRILFPTDGSPASLQAADAVARFAGPAGKLEVTIAVVISPLSAAQSDYRTEYLEPHNAWLRKEAQRSADRALEQLRARGLVCTTKVLEGSPVSAILAHEVAEGGYDVVVMSSRGLGQQHDRLRYLGSVTEHLIRRAAVPVLVVPVREEDDDD